MREHQRSFCCSELPQLTLSCQSLQRWCPTFSLLLSRGQLASAASTKTSSSCWTSPCPSDSFAWHGILRKAKHKLELTRVAPGLIIDECLFIEELVPDSTAATSSATESSLDSLATRLGFSSNSELRGTLRHPAPRRVSRLPGRSGWPLLLCNAVQLTGNSGYSQPGDINWKHELQAT